VSAKAKAGDGERKGVRFVLGAFIAFVIAWTGASTWQIMAAAFGAPLGAAAPPARSACSDALRAMAEAADSAAAVSLTAPDEASAVARYRGALGPSWDDDARRRTDAACAGAPHGEEGLAAVLRFGQAQEGFVRRRAIEIAPLRRDVSAYVPR